jgi:predicted N-acyltransferase
VNLELEVCPGVPPEWPELTAAGPHTVTPRWLELGADRLGGGYHSFILRAGDRPELAVGGTILNGPLPSPRVDPYRILSGRSAGLGLIPDGPHPWADAAPADVFPAVLFMYPNFDMFPVGRGAHDPALLRELVAKLLDWARATGIAAFAFLFATPDAAELMAVLAEQGAQAVPLAGTCVLDVTWDDFDGYLATLPRKRRVGARAELNRLAAAGVVLAEEKLDDVEADLLRLRGKLVAKYDGRPAPDRDRMLLDKIRDLFEGDEIMVVTARCERRMLGFALLLRDAAHWTALLVGTDYGDPRSRLTYFGVTFYRPAALAPGRGITSIGYGLGSWHAKRLRGCRVVPLLAAALPVRAGPGHRPSGGG